MDDDDRKNFDRIGSCTEGRRKVNLGKIPALTWNMWSSRCGRPGLTLSEVQADIHLIGWKSAKQETVKHYLKYIHDPVLTTSESG